MEKKPRKPPVRVSEPLQVYLTAEDRDLLDRAAVASGVPRAEIMRRGIRLVSTEVLATANPVADFLDAMANEEWSPSMPTDASAMHDHYLTELPARRSRKRGR